MTDMDYIREFVKAKRKYASFFEWYRREKSIKEVGIVKSLLQSISNDGLAALSEIRASENDPPDCIADTRHGTIFGFEVRELVDQEAIKRNEKGENVYRNWSPDAVVQELQKIIEEKDSKIYKGGPYEKLILVVPTDEPALSHRQLKSFLANHEFQQTKQLNEAYLLFSYDAEIKGYPHIKLKFLRSSRTRHCRAAYHER